MVRITTVQRMILTFMLDEEQRGRPSIIAIGHKKTRVGYFPALQAEGVATNSATLFFLRHNGLVEEVRAPAALLKGEEAYESLDVRYRLTAKGHQALSKPTEKEKTVSRIHQTRRPKSRGQE